MADPTDHGYQSKDIFVLLQMIIDPVGSLIKKDPTTAYDHRIHLSPPEAKLLLASFEEGNLGEVVAIDNSMALLELLQWGLLMFYRLKHGSGQYCLTRLGRVVWKILDERLIREE